jgi:hypothetical protein
MPENTEVVAFIYDRRMPARPGLRDRLQTCGSYAFERGWEICGWHVDHEPEALTGNDRPALDAGLLVMQRSAPGRRRVLLVASLDCLADESGARAALTNRIRAAGGEVLAVDTADLPTEGVAR